MIMTQGLGEQAGRYAADDHYLSTTNDFLGCDPTNNAVPRLRSLAEPQCGCAHPRRRRYLIGTTTGAVLYPETLTQFAGSPVVGTTPRTSTVSPGNTVT